ncbi:uncharacterized protein M421DRAFT_100470 [Didymella exigua CBS 183.55]|uniref:Uncharacterized protein n=1 Tax=Didymella exigua CBS 183.55 TaxID=1150837 RepID=A0A6A5RLR2_9PLEO|nr:uncharacterized protein M421DRAFT_100470 [Didymella exigua CBS 183.55]KAF1929365.1 hypothetical protein M421DRAFT_100470 [Didymella exigua CBS 183.55]
MKSLTHRLSRLKPSCFKISYSPTYTSFLPNHIAVNASHPLHIAQRRLRNEQKKEGLWWHVTNGTDLSKSSCVRHWARRRLTQAFVDELRERGYDDKGKMVDAGEVQDSYVQRVLKSGRRVDVTGSLRMHGVPLLVPAKYEKVKEEVRGVVEALVQSAVDEALELKGEERSGGSTTKRPQSHRPQNQRPQADQECVVSSAADETKGTC